METFLPAIFVFVFGAAVGSFLNVVIYRLPAGLSLLYPPSHCPKCENRLKPYDNVPVLGWLWLKGRCRYCRTAISGRYPLVEFLTGLLFFSVFGKFGWTFETVGFWALVSWLIALALIDLDTMTLPNPLTASGVVLGWLFQSGLAYFETPTLSHIMLRFMASFGATLLGIWLFDLINLLGTALLGQTAMGGGDAKLAAMLGAWFGWQGLLLSTFLACLLGALIGLSAIATKRLGRRQPIPFGPFLVLGAAITLFYGSGLIQGYLNLVLP
ncbi:MAG: prepilin peptidase [Cyanobacteria bacterium P01_G01_bin.38]